MTSSGVSSTARQTTIYHTTAGLGSKCCFEWSGYLLIRSPMPRGSISLSGIASRMPPRPPSCISSEPLGPLTNQPCPSSGIGDVQYTLQPPVSTTNDRHNSPSAPGPADPFDPAGARLPDIPKTRDEVLQASQVFTHGSRLLLGQEATEARFIPLCGRSAGSGSSTLPLMVSPGTGSRPGRSQDQNHRFNHRDAETPSLKGNGLLCVSEPLW